MRLVSVTLLLCTVCSTGYGEKESCEGLDKIDSSPRLDCDINENCLSMDCNVTSFAGHGAILILLPCDRPLPALKLLLKSPSGTTSLGKFDSSEPRRTTTASLSDAATFTITISWASTNIATIESSVTAMMGGDTFTEPLVQPTNITIPECVPAPTTCLALQQIAADASEELSCNTNGNEDCDTVVCTTDIMGLPLVTEFNVLSCNDPPAIAVIIMGGSSVIFDGVLTESQEIALFSSKLDITLDQLHNAIGLEVDFIEEGGVFNILSYTVIPIDKTECVDGGDMSKSAAIHFPMTSFEMMLSFTTFSSLLLYI